MTTVGDFEMSPAGVSISMALARPRSRTLMRPSGVTLMFAGFRSRWMTPFSCATESASAICAARPRASGTGQRAGGELFRQRLALDELHDDVPEVAVFLGPVDRGDPGMVDRRQHPGFALESRHAGRVAREGLGQDLDGHLAAELAVMGPVDLTHSAGAERTEDLVGAEPRTRVKGHGSCAGLYAYGGVRSERWRDARSPGLSASLAPAFSAAGGFRTRGRGADGQPVRHGAPVEPILGARAGCPADGGARRARLEVGQCGARASGRGGRGPLLRGGRRARVHVGRPGRASLGGVQRQDGVEPVDARRRRAPSSSATGSSASCGSQRGSRCRSCRAARSSGRARKPGSRRARPWVRRSKPRF